MAYINPLLKLPAARKIAALPPSPEKLLLVQLLRELRDDANELAEKSWAARKAPMAAYWRACATYCTHFSRVFGRVTEAMARALALATGKALPSQFVVPEGYKLVPIDHSVDSRAWDRMTLAIRPAMTHAGFNEPREIEAARIWDGNSSHLVHSIIAACPEYVAPPAAMSPTAPGAREERTTA